MSRGPQSRERHEHCSRTNSNLMDNFSQNHVNSVQVLHGNCQKKVFISEKRFSVTDTEWLRQSQTVHDRHCIDVLLIYGVLSQKYYALSRTICSPKNGAHGQKIFCGSLLNIYLTVESSPVQHGSTEEAPPTQGNIGWGRRHLKS